MRKGAWDRGLLSDGAFIFQYTFFHEILLWCVHLLNQAIVHSRPVKVHSSRIGGKINWLTSRPRHSQNARTWDTAVLVIHSMQCYPAAIARLVKPAHDKNPQPEMPRRAVIRKALAWGAIKRCFVEYVENECVQQYDDSSNDRRILKLTVCLEHLTRRR